MGLVLAWLAQSGARPLARDELIHFGGGPGKLDRELGGERTSTHTQGVNRCGQPGSALPRLRQEPHVPVKGRSLGVCPPPALGSPVPQPWAAITCALCWRKVAARGSREAGGTAVSPQLQLIRSRSQGMAVTQVFPRETVLSRVGRPRQDRPRPSTRVLLEPLSSDCAWSFLREPAWDTPPWHVPWCPSRASATFIPRTGTPGAQRRGHHFEFTTALCAALGLPRHCPCLGRIPVPGAALSWSWDAGGEEEGRAAGEGRGVASTRPTQMCHFCLPSAPQAEPRPETLRGHSPPW